MAGAAGRGDRHRARPLAQVTRRPDVLDRRAAVVRVGARGLWIHDVDVALLVERSRRKLHADELALAGVRLAVVDRECVRPAVDAVWRAGDPDASRADDVDLEGTEDRRTAATPERRAARAPYRIDATGLLVDEEVR